MDKTMIEDQCPRCGGPLRLKALSRADDETIVCGPCGKEEGLIDIQAQLASGLLPGGLLPGKGESCDDIACLRLRVVARAALHPVTGVRPWARWL